MSACSEFQPTYTSQENCVPSSQPARHTYNMCRFPNSQTYVQTVYAGSQTARHMYEQYVQVPKQPDICTYIQYVHIQTGLLYVHIQTGLVYAAHHSTMTCTYAYRKPDMCSTHNYVILIDYTTLFTQECVPVGYPHTESNFKETR